MPTIRVDRRTPIYQEGLARIRMAVSRSVERYWGDLPAYNANNVESFTFLAQETVGAGQRAALALTDGYMAALTEEAPIGLAGRESLRYEALRNGAAFNDVYRRPFVTVWEQLKAGTNYVDAVQAGLNRAASTARMDVALAARAGSREFCQEFERIVGVQRVPDGNACAFCIMASTQRYTTNDLMPIHNNCGCTTEPIMSSQRSNFSGQVKNDLDLDAPTDLALGYEYHGELGPVLVNGDHNFDSL